VGKFYLRRNNIQSQNQLPSSMLIEFSKIPLSQVHNLLQGTVVPRPIALASTVDHKGIVNLSPFSFFNVFSMNPPILIFSPSRRGRDNAVKHTYENVLEVMEVVINIVDFKMVQQTSLASVEYAKGVNEFIKSGLTPVPSLRVKPPRVEESPVSFECTVKQVVPLGEERGAGNLVICEILVAHIRDTIMDEQGNIDPQKLDAVARMGNDNYCRASGGSVFSVPKPSSLISIGFDQIPERIRMSVVLTGNDLAQLGSITELPDPESIQEFKKDDTVQHALKVGELELHRLAKKLLKESKLVDAWKVLLMVED
jgi:flavin reductase (DIM6/NTAB) family NADH-FMN oxidoreductase RutF